MLWILFLTLSSVLGQELTPNSNYRLTLHDGKTVEGKLLSRKGNWIKLLHEDNLLQFNLYFVSQIEKVIVAPTPIPPGSTLQDRDNELTFASWNAEWLFLHESRRKQINQDRPNSFDEASVAMENRPLDLVEEEWKFSSVAKVLAHPPCPEISTPQVIALQEVGSLTAAKEVARRLKEMTGYNYIAFSRSKINYAPGHDSSLLIRDTLKPEEIDFRQEILNWSQKDAELKNFTHLNEIPLEGAFPRICMATFEFKGQKILIVSLHLTSGDARDNLRQSNVLRVWLRILQEHNPELSVILCGDFNDFENRSTMSIIQGQPKRFLQDALYTAREFNGRLNIDPKRIGPLTTNQYSPKPIDHVLLSYDFFSDELGSYTGLVLDRLWIVREGVIIGDVDPRNRRGTRHSLLIFKERDVSDHYPIFARFRKSF